VGSAQKPTARSGPLDRAPYAARNAKTFKAIASLELKTSSAVLTAMFLAVMGVGCGQSGGSARADGGDDATGAGGAGGTGGFGIDGAAGSPPPSGNKIVNGDFSDGQTNWGVESSSTYVTASVTNGQLCVMSPAGVLVTVIWPGGLSPVASLVPGATNVLAYQASSNVPLSTFEVQIGPVDSLRAGTSTDLDVTTDAPTANIQTFSHSFSVAAIDDQAGLAFKLEYGIYSGLSTVCFDNVSLTTNN